MIKFLAGLRAKVLAKVGGWITKAALAMLPRQARFEIEDQYLDRINKARAEHYTRDNIETLERRRDALDKRRIEDAAEWNARVERAARKDADEDARQRQSKHVAELLGGDIMQNDDGTFTLYRSAGPLATMERIGP